MAKDQEKKRKLERDSLGQDASNKRAKVPKQTKGKDEILGNGPSTPIDSAQDGKFALRTGQSHGQDHKQYKQSRGKEASRSIEKVLEDSNTRSTSQVNGSDIPNANGTGIVSKTKKQKYLVPTMAGQNGPGGLVKSTPDAALATNTKNLNMATVIRHGGEAEHIWRLSKRVAGTFLDQDPIFVRDNGEDYVISASKREVLLLSLETSQIVRSHPAPEHRRIACFCLGAAGKQLLDIAYDNGDVVQWDWSTLSVSEKALGAQGEIMAMVKTPDRSGNLDTYQIELQKNRYRISLNGHSIYETQKQLKGLQVLGNGGYLAALTSSTLILGLRKKEESKAAEIAASNYVWVEVPSLKHAFTCFDAKIIGSTTTGKKQRTQSPGLTVAVGNAHGQILLYSNVLSIFSAPVHAQLPTPRILHWHPERVSTVRFAQDGDYLISGGKETVMVFWQLATGKTSFLPHLTAEIERLVVNPDGTRYALLLGDNSILVLNSTEQSPVAHFAGLQMPSKKSIRNGLAIPRVTATLRSQSPQQLLLTVPASQPKRLGDITARPYLQTFDIQNSRHLSRQALTRNNVTDLNIGPDNRPVIPPDVHLLAVSQDGQWMATLDEWIPQASDLEHLVPRSTALGEEELEEVQRHQRARGEVFLKFWRWQQKGRTWALNTRVEAPHSAAVDAHVSSGPGQVFRLTADPSSNGFVTVGEDGHVKIWRPKTRTRHGVPLQNGTKEELVEWVCKRDIALPGGIEGSDRADSPMDSSENVSSLEDAILTISEDGSLIACALVPSGSEEVPVVHFITASTGEIGASRTGLTAPDPSLVDLAFAERYLLSLSNGAFRVWNLVEDRVQYHIDFPLRNNDYATEEPMMAVDHDNETFAVLRPVGATDQPGTVWRMEIHGLQQSSRLLELTFADTPLAILSGKNANGYTLLFDDATVQTISPIGSSAQLIASSVTEQLPNLTANESGATESEIVPFEVDVHGEDTEMMEDVSLDAIEAVDDVVVEDDEDDRPVVRPEQLASVFDVGQSLLMPPVKEMFDAVVGLFARKPRLGGFDGDIMEVDV